MFEKQTREEGMGRGAQAAKGAQAGILDRMMRRWMQGAFVCLLAVLMLGAAAPGADESSARFGRIGHNMICMCGCGQVLLECNHVGCGTSGPMIDELHAQLAGPNSAGADSLIFNWFVAKYGATVLAAPIRGGFDNVAWIVPITIFVLATLGTAMLVRMWSQNRRSVPAGAPSALLEDDVRARIRRETEY